MHFLTQESKVDHGQHENEYQKDDALGARLTQLEVLERVGVNLIHQCVVEFAGPPSVIRLIGSKTWKLLIVQTMVEKNSVGEIIGSVIWKDRKSVV